MIVEIEAGGKIQEKKIPSFPSHFVPQNHNNEQGKQNLDTQHAEVKFPWEGGKINYPSLNK